MPLQVSREAKARATWPSGSSPSAVAMSLHGWPRAAAVCGPISALNSSEPSVKRPSSSICQTKRSGWRRSRCGCAAGCSGGGGGFARRSFGWRFRLRGGFDGMRCRGFARSRCCRRPSAVRRGGCFRGRRGRPPTKPSMHRSRCAQSKSCRRRARPRRGLPPTRWRRALLRRERRGFPRRQAWPAPLASHAAARRCRRTARAVRHRRRADAALARRVKDACPAASVAATRMAGVPIGQQDPRAAAHQGAAHASAETAQPLEPWRRAMRQRAGQPRDLQRGRALGIDGVTGQRGG